MCGLTLSMPKKGSAEKLRRVKVDVETTTKGQECGLLLQVRSHFVVQFLTSLSLSLYKAFDKMEVGDRIECYKMIDVAPEFVPYKQQS